MQPIEPEVPVAEPVEPARQAWYHKIGALLFIILCFEVGVFLVVFPWMQYWDHNAIARLAPWAREIWDSPFFRGALSGLGLLNIYISLAEVFRLRRRRATD
jgi:hypothetical protein